MTAAVNELTIETSGGSVILHRVDLELNPGEVTALLGESGAGKTTLAHALLGHVGPGLRRTRGSVTICGEDAFAPAAQRRIRGRAVAYLPQDPSSALDPRRRIAAQLRTAARTAHPADPSSTIAERVHAAADAASLDRKLLERYPAQLSGGQAQRVLLAWAFVSEPELLILDEPTSGLDPATARSVSDSFTSLPWRPAVLLVSHDRDLAARVAAHRIELDGGRLRRGSEAVRSSAPRRTPKASAPRPGDIAARDVGDAHIAPGAGAVLAATGVTVRRGGSTLLRDAEITLTAGELLAIRGASGSGKTSLARAICGFDPPDSGTLIVHGARVGWDAGSRARHREPFLAYVAQDARATLNPHETVRRTLKRASLAAGRRGMAGATAVELLDRFGLPRSALDRTPDRLSGGQRHRLALIRAVSASPTVLVCDETMAALDHNTVRLILDALDEIRHTTGMPIVLITHQDAVARRADRILTLSEGRLR